MSHPWKYRRNLEKPIKLVEGDWGDDVNTIARRTQTGHGQVPQYDILS